MNEPTPSSARTPALRARLDELSASSEDVSWLAPRVRERLSRNGPRSTRARWLALAIGVAAAVFAFVMIGPTSWTSSANRINGGGTERVKGSAAALNIYRQTPAGSERLEDGSIAHAGDVLRIGYRLADPGYGVIVSLDDRGVVTRHLPSNAARASTLTNGDVVLLDQAYELDDSPRWERFFIVTGQIAFDIEPVVQAVRRLTDSPGAASTLSLPPQLEQSSFLLKKDSRP